MIKKMMLKVFSLTICLLFLLGQYDVVAQAGVKKDTSGGWKQLFNGKDLSGWKHVGKGGSLVEDGMIHGKGGMGLLYWTKEKFSNCTIRSLQNAKRKQ